MAQPTMDTDLAPHRNPGRRLLIVAWIAYLIAAITLLISASGIQPHSAAGDVADRQWLALWAILFVTVILSTVKLAGRYRSTLLVAAVSVFGVVAVSLLFSGTIFGYNSIWGDSKLYLAMILKFRTYGPGVDMYLKDLPSFYPPMYFLVLSFGSWLTGTNPVLWHKAGYWLVYALGPAVLFLLWRRLLSSFQAALVVLVTFIYSAERVVVTPHEFLAGALIIPWWFGYASPPRFRDLRWQTFVIGALIGGALFSTYYYPFFVIGILLLATTIHTLFAGSANQISLKSVRWSWLAMAGSALVCLPYWGPLLLSVFHRGGDPTQADWFNPTYIEFRFPFLQVTLLGLTTLWALGYAARRTSSRLYRGLLFVLGASAALYAVAYVLGNLGMPVLYHKAGDFSVLVSATILGLALATLVRRGWQRRLRHTGIGLLGLGVVTLAGAVQFEDLLETKPVTTARRQVRPDWLGIKPDPTLFRDKVYLTSYEQLPSLYPCYVFIPTNQHYTHWAGQFRERHMFLKLLEDIDDPAVMQFCLRHNAFAAVDYAVLQGERGYFILPASLNNYPFGLGADTIRLRQSAFMDSARFVKLSEKNFYRVLPGPDSLPDIVLRSSSLSTYDSVAFSVKINHLASFLEPASREPLLQHFDIAVLNWSRQGRPIKPMAISRDIALIDHQIVPVGDSLYFVSLFRAERAPEDDLRLFLHVVTELDSTPQQNFDFQPPTSTRQWRIGEVIACVRAIPRPEREFAFETGLFNAHGRQHGVYRGRYRP